MPLQNRVTPWGEIIKTPARGTLFGNRGGCFHTVDQELLPLKRWVGRRWIACLLEFKGRRRKLMQPNRYTELFFLDEATALAAGHRPCAQCRWGDYNRFIDAWLAGNAVLRIERARCTDAIDAVLHRERVTPRREKVTYLARLGDLPDGVFVTFDGAAGAWTPRDGRLHRWTSAGYAESRPAAAVHEVRVLTPRSIVNAIAAGYVPMTHPTLANA
ncbi:MAG TPA: hypothetical protein VKV26_20480 [Dehalococcoidia bacterium]|nr:hypothetical protein [Dehalococcoidia bacterium]